MKRLIKLLFIIVVVVSCTKEPPTYVISTNSTKGGHIKISTQYPMEGDSIFLQAIPDEENYTNYKFTGWSGDLNSTQNPIKLAAYSDMVIQANFELKTILEDDVYSKIIPGDFTSFLSAFVQDARRNGVDLSNVDVLGSEIEIRDMEIPGYAAAGCDPNKARIGVNKNMWENSQTSEYIFIMTIQMMWHEFGHDILGLSHLCLGGQVMSGRHQGPKGDCGDENLEYITVYSLKYNEPDLYRNWQRGVEDMFTGNHQIWFECRTDNTSKNGDIIYD